MPSPRVGDRVAYFRTGRNSPDETAIANVIRVHTTELIDVQPVNEPATCYRSVVYAPHSSVVDGKRPANSWDFIV